MADVRRELRGRDFWVLSAFVGVLLIPFLLAPTVMPFAFGAVPILVSAAYGRIALTAMVAVVGVVLSVAVLAVGDYSDMSDTRRMAIVLVAALIALVLAWVVARWKARVAEQAEQYRLLAENVMDAVISVRPDLTVVWASPSIEQVLGYVPGEVVGRNVRDLLADDERDRLRGGTRSVLSGDLKATNARFRTASGDSVWVESVPRLLYDRDGHLRGIVIAIRDVGEQMAIREALERELEYDGLTGLAKRHLGLQRVDEVLARGPASSWALVSVGVQGMTRINHAYSHQAGDRVLQWVAEQLVKVAGSPDRVARIAGDEFALIQHDVDGADAAEHAAHRILDSITGTVEFEGQLIDVAATVGIAFPHGTGSDDLLGDAIEARRRTARSGVERWAVAEGDAGTRAREVLALQTALREALAAGAIRPWFMPVVSLTDRRLTGYECLMRWQKDDGTVVGPDGFLSVAEQSGLIREIDREVFAQAVARAARAPDVLEFGINVSAATMAVGDFSTWMAETMAAHGLRPDRVMLEVTETALMHVSPRTVAAMEDLARLGMSWWVDDFGTGFSSISHLRDLPIAGLKLDRSFTRDAADPASRSAHLARGLAGLAEGMGLWTVAEGVETRAQAVALRDQGWGFGQGWYFGRPESDLRPAAPLERGEWP